MMANDDDLELSAGVTLTADDVRDAVRLLELLVDGGAKIARSPEKETARASGLAAARLSMASRNDRSKFFPRAMFGEPAWDLLLALYAHQGRSHALTISNLANIAQTPVTTALRWIDYLDEKGLVLRERSNIDRRASEIRLSDDGRARLDRYFLDMIARVDESGLAPVGE